MKTGVDNTSAPTLVFNEESRNWNDQPDRLRNVRKYIEMLYHIGLLFQGACPLENPCLPGDKAHSIHYGQFCGGLHEKEVINFWDDRAFSRVICFYGMPGR